MSQMESGDAGRENMGLKNIGWISMVGTSLWMVVLQGLLFVIHRSGRSRPRSGLPSREEISVGITVFWMFQLGLWQIVAGIRVLSEFAANEQRREVGHQDINNGVSGLGYRWLWSGIILLFRRVLLTWGIHLGLVILLDTVIPFWQVFRLNPQTAMERLQRRFAEITSFLDITLQNPSDLSILPKERSKEILKSNDQRIHLQRRQTDNPNEGQRRLSWNIVVDKDAMDEMKETLGPPGGFGELGFNVARDGVKFEAMGVGTSFNLMFKLKGDDENRTARGRARRKKSK
jgi:hypothetical protein